MTVLYGFLSLIVLGSLFGFFLSFANKKLSVEKDSRLDELEAVMPGANCGGCGYAGCSAYAQAIFDGSASIGLCIPGGQGVTDKCAEIMNLSGQKTKKLRAFVFCNAGISDSVRQFNYDGPADCNASYILLKGLYGCKEGCLHFGSCISVCPVNAIKMDKDGKVEVIKELCIGCGKCARVCPTGSIRLIPYETGYVVKCNNHENGIAVKNSCSTGCLGCKICQNKYPQSGFYVSDFLAFHDGETMTQQTDSAVENCPRKIIYKI